MPHLRQARDQGSDAIDFVFHEGQIEIHCRISFDALRRQAGVAELNRQRAQRLLNWYRPKIERIALAHYAAGDLCDGVVTIDTDDIAAPGGPR